MSYSMLPLLVHCPGIPSHVRALVRAASTQPPAVRRATLEGVVELLRAGTGLELEDARELLDLPEPTAPIPACAPRRWYQSAPLLEISPNRRQDAQNPTSLSEG